VEPHTGTVAPEDRDALAHLDPALRERLLLEAPVDPEFVVRFQQATGPVMAKGVEDTAFYRWLRLTALNEVGGNPARFSLPVDDFHVANRERAERFPRHLLATQTHDTKRSGDVRARIGALAGLAEQWAERARAWQYLDDPAENYLLLQTALGAWPLEQERLAAYMEKAVREAGINSGWVDPDEAHERRLRAGIGRFYEQRPAGWDELAARVAVEGERVSLAQTLLKLTVPGLPDIYQGDELPSLNLVDPDNRRPVDWAARRAALAQPPPKLRVITEALALRARRPDAFAGAYAPLDAGPDACAFLRGEGQVLVAVPLRRPGEEPELPVPAGRWRDPLGQRELRLRGGERLGELLGDLPVLLLEQS
jgi:(1->4)-alpha-D-glucan 1-alpha-D-glucosylmutase